MPLPPPKRKWNMGVVFEETFQPSGHSANIYLLFPSFLANVGCPKITFPMYRLKPLSLEHIVPPDFLCSFDMALVEPKKVAGGAFGQFLAEKRSELQKELQGKPVTEITKLASAKFKALSEEERAIYQEKYLTAKAKYEADLKAFEEAGGEKKQRKAKGKKDGKKKKDPDAPKRPGGGAYGCFLAKHRAAFQKETAGQPVTAVTKLASAKWSALSADEKKIYEDEYKAKKEAYDEAMKSYVPRAAVLKSRQ